MGKNSLSGHLAAAKTGHHGNVSAQITAPAHTHGGKYGHIVGGSHAGSYQIRYQTDGGSRSTEGGDGNGNIGRIVETEQRPGNKADFVTDPGKESYSFVSCAGVLAGSGRPVGQNQNDGTDDHNTGDNGKSHVYADLSAF